MKKTILMVGMIIVLMFSLIILTGCGATNVDTEIVEDTGEVETKEEVTMKDYSYEGLSFKLPSNYMITPSDNEDAVIYSVESDDALKLFSVATIPAQGTNFLENASDSLKEYEFKLVGYEATSRKDPTIVEYNGIKVISIDVNYESSAADSAAEVEYCYAQNGDTIYVICFEFFNKTGEKIEATDFANEFTQVKDSLKFAE